MPSPFVITYDCDVCLYLPLQDRQHVSLLGVLENYMLSPPLGYVNPRMAHIAGFVIGPIAVLCSSYASDLGRHDFRGQARS